MKKFAVITASLLLFVGCAQNDQGDMGAETTTTDTTATGAAAPGQTGSDTDTMSTQPVPPPLDTNQLNQPDNTGAPAQTQPGIDQGSNPSPGTESGATPNNNPQGNP